MNKEYKIKIKMGGAVPVLGRRYDYIAKGTFLSRKEDFYTKGRFYFKILNSSTIIVHSLSFKRFKEIGNSFCMTFTSL